MGRPRRLFSQDEITKIVKMYNNGETTKNIAKCFKVGGPRIIEVLKESNVEFRKRGELIRREYTDSEIKKIVDMYTQGFWIRDIEKELKTDIRKIVPVLEDNGFIISGSRKYYCNFDFFDKIDTPEKAYWLGLMFADGWVDSNGNTCNLGLKYSDKYHLHNFIKAIDGTYPVRVDCSNRNFSTVHISSKKMSADLKRHGCVPNKSLILKPPVGVPQELTRDFIRGYFDGDGSVGFYPSYNKIQLIFLGTHDLLQWIKDSLKRVGINSMTLKQRRKIYEMYIYRKSNFKIFYDYIYENSAVKLERKHKIFLDIISHYNLQ